MGIACFTPMHACWVIAIANPGTRGDQLFFSYFHTECPGLGGLDIVDGTTLDGLIGCNIISGNLNFGNISDPNFEYVLY